MSTPTASAPTTDYEPFCAAVLRVCGIDLAQYKRGQMERRIRAFAAQRGTPDLPAYAQRIAGDREELERFLDRVTINVSQLWRNPDQWVKLATLLPDLVQGGRLRCWSAGCSYGAEAYTLAAIARDQAPRATVTILGTDIDMRMVEQARAGLFTAEDARDAPRADLERHFAAADGGWQASPELRRMVTFKQGDLLRVAPGTGTFDLVLCRNTVIYFNEEVRDALHGRLADSLRAGGLLIVGSTERVARPSDHGLVSDSPFVYRKQ